jgi:hypothetical protein
MFWYSVAAAWYLIAFLISVGYYFWAGWNKAGKLGQYERRMKWIVASFMGLFFYVIFFALTLTFQQNDDDVLINNNSPAAVAAITNEALIATSRWFTILAIIFIGTTVNFFAQAAAVFAPYVSYGTRKLDSILSQGKTSGEEGEPMQKKSKVNSSFAKKSDK